MPVITFDPAAIDTNTTSITSNQTVASDAESDAALASGAASTADSKAVVASGAASTADSKAVVASDAASDADSDAAVASGAASDAESDAAVASGAASTADSKAVVASGAASDAQSDATSIATDDKFAKSIISDPSSSSFAILTLQVTSASLLTLSHSTVAV